MHSLLVDRALLRVWFRSPLLVYLLPFISGQLLGELIGISALLGLFVLWLLLWRFREKLQQPARHMAHSNGSNPIRWVADFLRRAIFWRRGRFVRLWWCMAAIAGATLVVLPGGSSPMPVGDSSVNLLLKLSERPRYPRPGLIQASVLVLGEVEDVRYLPTGPAVDVAPWQGRKLLCRAIHLPWRNLSQAKPGDIFAASLSLSPLPQSSGLFSYGAMLRRRGYAARCRIRWASAPLVRDPSWLQRLQIKVKEIVRSRVGEGEAAGILLSMTQGARDTVSRRTEFHFKRGGLAHLLVVSGYHIAVVFLSAAALLRAVVFRISWIFRTNLAREAVQALSLVVAILFVAFVGMQASAIRAAVAMVITAVGATSERGGGMLNSMAAAMLFLVVIWPGSFLDAGVQLTFAALTGIYLAHCWWSQPGFISYLAMCCGASLCSGIIGMFWFGTFSLAGFLLNPLLAPVMAFLGCKLGILGLIATWVGIDPQGYILGFSVAALEYCKQVVAFMADWSFAAIEV